MVIKDILVLLDSTSQAVGPYAVSLASSFDAHLTAAAVVVDATTAVALADAPSVFLASALEEARAAARKILEEFKTATQGSGIAIETESVEAVVGMTGQALGPLARISTSRLLNSPTPTFRPRGKS